MRLALYLLVAIALGTTLGGVIRYFRPVKPQIVARTDTVYVSRIMPPAVTPTVKDRLRTDELKPRTVYVAKEPAKATIDSLVALAVARRDAEQPEIVPVESFTHTDTLLVMPPLVYEGHVYDRKAAQLRLYFIDSTDPDNAHRIEKRYEGAYGHSARLNLPTGEVFVRTEPKPRKVGWKTLVSGGVVVGYVAGRLF